MIPDLLPRELTSEERDHAEKWLAQWIAFAHSTEPVDRPAAERAVQRAYEVAGLVLPERFSWYQSPNPLMRYLDKSFRQLHREGGGLVRRKLFGVADEGPSFAATSMAAVPFIMAPNSFSGVMGLSFEETTNVNFQRTEVSGLWDRGEANLIIRPWGWLRRMFAFSTWNGLVGVPFQGPGLLRETFCHEHVLHSPEDDGKASRVRAVAQASVSVGCFMPQERACLICERPSELHVNEDGELHRAEGPAVAYQDGFCVYALQGIQFEDRHWFTTSPTHWDPRKVLRVENVEERRELIRVIGIGKLLKHLSHRVLDSTDGYVLYSVTLDDSVRDARFLEMTHASVPGLTLLEGVEGNTVEEAINWRAGELGENIDWNPYQLT